MPKWSYDTVGTCPSHLSTHHIYIYVESWSAFIIVNCMQEERKGLFSDNNLSEEKFEAWKKV